MNDFEFGNYIYERRCKAGMTQAEMAEQLGVTNKAVSKWETGKSKPTTNTLRKMAVLFGLSIEELLKIREGEKKWRSQRSLSLVALVPVKRRQ